mgnify:CR=1 FL=1
MKPEKVKRILRETVQELNACKWLYSVRPGKDNTRKRKFPFEKMISSILAFRAGTLSHEIMDFFGIDPSIGSSSAFVQQRAKILPEAFDTLFHSFTEKITKHDVYRGYHFSGSTRCVPYFVACHPVTNLMTLA